MNGVHDTSEEDRLTAVTHTVQIKDVPPDARTLVTLGCPGANKVEMRFAPRNNDDPPPGTCVLYGPSGTVTYTPIETIGDSNQRILELTRSRRERRALDAMRRHEGGNDEQ